MSSPSPAPEHPVSPPARLPTLDGLRAIAILLVVPHNLDLIATFDGAQLVVAALHRGWYGPFHQGPDPVSHFWSLALEEQFYLLWPFVIHRRSAGWVMRLCLAIAAASLLLRVVMLLAGTPAQAIYQFLVTRMDALALGGAAAAAFRVPSAASWTLDHRRFLLGASLLSLVGGAVLSRGYYFTHPVTLSLGFTFLAVGFALLVAAVVAADLLGAAGWPAALRWSFLRRVAKYSYAMYVLSVPLHFLVGKPVLSALGLAAGNP